ncbi:MAG: class I SAM-dependent methyltransferase [Candidatus Hadarchaeota archaeon]|nr:class I SAM-dependent methyltransferase [Candidatus Hadarchaeota archaeon]
MKRAKEISMTFDKLCEKYDAWYSSSKGKLVGESELGAIRELLPGGSGLEVGVGGGFFASKLGVELGVDPAVSCLRKARARGVRVVLGVGECLPFRKNSFDFLLYAVALSFLTDLRAALKEARRVLRARGKVIVCFIPKGSAWGKFYLEKKATGHRFYKHASFLQVKEAEGLLEQVGFKAEDAYSTLFQGPEKISDVESPVEGGHETAGFCCIKAKKV